MYIIKQVPDDFIVKEIPRFSLSDAGEYSIYLLKKREFSTQAAVSIIAQKIGTEPKRIGYAGAKDKAAVTEQYISIQHANRERIENLHMQNVELLFMGNSRDRINLGCLSGNSFEIVIRNLTKDELCVLLKNLKKAKNQSMDFPNYFDEQRFSKNNYNIGKSILKKDFKRSVELILDFSFEKNNINTGDYDMLLDKSKNVLTRVTLSHLIKNKNDFIGAIRKNPRKISLLYIHAVQSYIFNETLSGLIRKKSRKYTTVDYSLGLLEFPKTKILDKIIPLVGFGSLIKDDDIGKIINAILKKEGIEKRDFIVREVPELSSEGGLRNVIAKASEIRNEEPENDELNHGMKKIKINFSLCKASYATMFIRSLFA